MVDHPEWYPHSQVCYPPELPPYFKNIHELKPIVGAPSDDEVIGIHVVMHAASRVSGVSGMHDPIFFMQLADHLFNAQMARYRSKYSLVTFPSNATYTPPALPAHISANLGPVSGAPSDEEIIKVHDTIQTYQELRRIPSLFDARVNMELSQHLFDLQMARHMRISGESQPRPMSQIAEGPTHPTQSAEITQRSSGDSVTGATNSTGTGANVADMHHISQPTADINIRDLMERSNQLAERFNLLLEHSNELVERHNQRANKPSSQPLAEQFNQVLERLTQIVGQTHQPTEQPDQMTDRFNQLFERLNQLVEQSTQYTQRANELSWRSNDSADRANKLAERLNESHEWSNRLSEQANQTWEQVRDVLGNVNRVLVKVQHAIVRALQNHKGNTINALDCLVNEKGEPPTADSVLGVDFQESSAACTHIPKHRIPVMIDGVVQEIYVHNRWLGHFLHFYDIDHGLRTDPTSIVLRVGQEAEARKRLGKYLSSCLG
ncbi:unnamed protein product [Rhizoctonia solani]|uniref:Laminin domain protein n=1 Tax=Rhizoctonia solani TaxID=456999 RepID=A0A8H3HWV2_9AGAM|nr:unnamed protein product [Rhizoctonia solani]